MAKQSDGECVEWLDSQMRVVLVARQSDSECVEWLNSQMVVVLSG